MGFTLVPLLLVVELSLEGMSDRLCRPRHQQAYEEEKAEHKGRCERKKVQVGGPHRCFLSSHVRTRRHQGPCQPVPDLGCSNGCLPLVSLPAASKVRINVTAVRDLALSDPATGHAALRVMQLETAAHDITFIAEQRGHHPARVCRHDR